MAEKIDFPQEAIGGVPVHPSGSAEGREKLIMMCFLNRHVVPVQRVGVLNTSKVQVDIQVVEVPCKGVYCVVWNELQGCCGVKGLGTSLDQIVVLLEQFIQSRKLGE